jgi:hypothetical protein
MVLFKNDFLMMVLMSMSPAARSQMRALAVAIAVWILVSLHNYVCVPLLPPYHFLFIFAVASSLEESAEESHTTLRSVHQ